MDDFGSGEHAGGFCGAGVKGGLASGGVFVVVGEADVGGLVVSGIAGGFHHFGVFCAGGAGIYGYTVNGAAAADGLGAPGVTGDGFISDEGFDLGEGHGVFVVEHAVVDNVAGVEIGGLNGASGLSVERGERKGHERE